MKNKKIFFGTFTYLIFVILCDAKLCSLKKLRLENPDGVVCNYVTPRPGYDKRSETCLDKSKYNVENLYDCQATAIIQPVFGYTWFYCYPDRNNKSNYLRVELISCLGVDVQKDPKTNKEIIKLVPGTNYRDKCKVPIMKPETKSLLIYVTNCKGNEITFNFNDFIDVKDNALYCKP